MHRMAPLLPGQRSGCDLAAAAGTTRTSLRIDAVAAPAPALPTSAFKQIGGSQDEWAFVLAPPVQKGSGACCACSDNLHEPAHALLGRREPLQPVSCDDDCDAELIISCGAGADVFAEEVILC